MASQTDPPRDDRQVGRTIELLIRVGVVVLIVFWCFTLVRPFIVPFVWGVIIAIATFPFFERLRRALGNRRILAAVLLALVLLVLIIVPAMLLGSTLLDTAQRIGAQMNAGTLVIPPPPPEIAEVPLIGDDIENFWQLASENLRAALDKVGPQIRALGRWLLSAAAGTGIGILQFIFAIIIAAALQVNAGGGGRFADEVATRLAGERGPDFADLARDTIHSVARGILGVALIQAILAGLGFLAFGVPFAGFLALACLVLSVVQIGTAVVIVPVIIYIFSVAETTTGVLSLVVFVPISLVDNVLKPIMLGRGVKVPMLVIFVGAIGGFIASGIIGLFVGAVVLALSYTVGRAWLYGGPAALPDAS